MSDFGRKRVTFEEQLALPRAVEYLEDLAAGLKSGKVKIVHDGSSVTLRPNKLLTLKVKVRHKRERETLSFELRWDNAAPEEHRETLSINDRTPEPEPAQ